MSLALSGLAPTAIGQRASGNFCSADNGWPLQVQASGSELLLFLPLFPTCQSRSRLAQAAAVARDPRTSFLTGSRAWKGSLRSASHETKLQQISWDLYHWLPAS